MLESYEKTLKDRLPEFETVYGKLTSDEIMDFSRVIYGAKSKNYNTSIPQVYLRIPKVLNFDDNGMIDGQQDPANTIPQELPKEGTDVDTSKSQWYLEIPKAITAIQWTGNNQQAMEEFCNNGRYRLSDNGDGTLRLADSERTTVINQGDYVASLKSGFSVYKADDFVREYQFIEKNSEAQPAGFEQKPDEGDIPPPPPLPDEQPQQDAPQNFGLVRNIVDAPNRALNKVQKINSKFDFLKKFESGNIHKTGKKMMSKLPGQSEFSRKMEENFGLVSKAVDFVKDTAGSVAMNTASNAFNRIKQRGTQQAKQMMSTPKPAPTPSAPAKNFNIDGIMSIVIKKQCCGPTLEAEKGVDVVADIDRIFRDALAHDHTRDTGCDKVSDTQITEIFGI